MSVHIAQAKIKTERVAEIRAAASEMFAALDAARPEGVRYAWGVLPDGETFVVLVQVDDGVENSIPDLPEYQALQERLVGGLAESPDSQPLTVVGSYRLF